VIRDAGRLVADLERAVVIDRDLEAFVLGELVAAADQPPPAADRSIRRADRQIERGIAAGRQ
jgi:hypothetical protein